jgi:hypothetical protein
MEGYTPTRLPGFVVTDEAALFAAFGIGDLAAVEGMEGRIVRLSPSSDIACPMHELELRPDSCRSCRLLAGESRYGEG